MTSISTTKNEVISIPKIKISKDMILQASFALLKTQGYKAVNARNIAKEVGCSVQPIYSYYENMEDLMEELFRHVRQFYLSYVESHSDKEYYFAYAGKCHIRFAREEKYLFQFLFLSAYPKVAGFQEFYEQFGRADIEAYIETALALEEANAKELYTNMMIFTHGIAVMIATGAADLTEEEIGEKVDAAFQAFLELARKKRM